MSREMRERDGSAGAGRWGRGVRGMAGVLAGGLVALAVALGVARFVAGHAGSPGPPAVVLWSHAVAAAVAVVVVGWADRREGWAGAPALAMVLVLTAVLLGVHWYT